MKSLILAGLLCIGLQAQAFDLQGHRGARGLAPENTLPGFALALSLGVTTLETDIAVSRDGVLVISHDPALNPDITRGPDGQFLSSRGPVIWHADFAELQRYDVGRLKPGTRYAEQYPQQKPHDGARLPRLDELFALVKKSGNSQVRLALEIKVRPDAPDETPAPEPFARKLVDAVRAAGMAERTTILSFDWRALQAVQKIAPEIGTVYLSIQRPQFDNIGAGKPGPWPWTAGFGHAEHGSVPKMIKAAGGRYLVELPPRSGRRQGPGSAGAGHQRAGLDRQRPGADRARRGPGRGRHRHRPAGPGARRDAAPRHGAAGGHAGAALSRPTPTAQTPGPAAGRCPDNRRPPSASNRTAP